MSVSHESYVLVTCRRRVKRLPRRKKLPFLAIWTSIDGMTQEQIAMLEAVAKALHLPIRRFEDVFQPASSGIPVEAKQLEREGVVLLEWDPA